jgi:hypothetical protein
VRVPLAAAALTGIIALTAMVWRVTARATEEAATDTEPPTAEISPGLTAPTPAPVSDPAPAPAAVPSMARPDEAVVLDEPPPSERPTRKHKPWSKRTAEPPPVVDQRPLSVTEKDVKATLDRMQRECAVWGIARDRRATLDIAISSEGKATHQAVGTSDPFFVDCLKGKLKQAQFPQSQSGGKFRHIFVCC